MLLPEELKQSEPDAVQALDQWLEKEAEIEFLAEDLENEGARVDANMESVRTTEKFLDATQMGKNPQILQDHKAQYVADTIIHKLGITRPEDVFKATVAFLRAAKKSPIWTGNPINDLYGYLRLRRTGLILRG